MSKKAPKAGEEAEEQRDRKNEVQASTWAQRHGGLVFLLIVCGIIGFALLYEFLKH